MDGKFNNHPFGNNNDDDHSPENRDTAVAGSKRSISKGRGIKKRVVTVAMKDMVQAGSRLPFDSWAWRKYGQKPIKGSPYPRGYYRCSSSKGCPARKQVERNHLDSTKLLITYSSEHNHSAPPTPNRNHHHLLHLHTTASVATSPPPVTTTTTTTTTTKTTTDAAFVGDLGEEFRWFSDLEGTPSSSAVLESPMMLSLDHGELDMAGMLFPDEDSLFSDLGELPECAVVFRRCHMAPWWCAGPGKH